LSHAVTLSLKMPSKLKIWTPSMKTPTKKNLLSAITTITNFLNHKNLCDVSNTPQRVLQFYEDFFYKYSNTNINEAVEKSLLSAENYAGQKICVSNINFVSFCEHHLLKFEGSVDICYIPQKYIIGFDKISLIINYHSHTLTLQEKLTQQILQTFTLLVKPSFCEVKITATHDCMRLRGQCKTTASITTTQSFVQNF